MSEMKHYKTAPGDRILRSHKIIYGFGALVYKLIAGAIGGMAKVLHLGQGIHPVLESAHHQYIRIIGVRCGS